MVCVRMKIFLEFKVKVIKLFLKSLLNVIVSFGFNYEY